MININDIPDYDDEITDEHEFVFSTDLIKNNLPPDSLAAFYHYLEDNIKIVSINGDCSKFSGQEHVLCFLLQSISEDPILNQMLHERILNNVDLRLEVLNIKNKGNINE